MKFGVVIFPGSNCDRDVIHVVRNVLKQPLEEIWHKDTSLNNFQQGDCIIVPGGFSYGDYLRPGAISRFSPIMDAVIDFANDGGFVFGICNGFQILCETGLLPGVLLRNKEMKFICKNTFIKVETTDSAITSGTDVGQVMNIPVAHADGRYYADAITLAELKNNNQILFRYSDEAGNVDASTNLNGSEDNIAGICNSNRNVFGMMPHPERASEAALGNTDGRIIFDALVQSVPVHS